MRSRYRLTFELVRYDPFLVFRDSDQVLSITIYHSKTSKVNIKFKGQYKIFSHYYAAWRLCHAARFVILLDAIRPGSDRRPDRSGPQSDCKAKRMRPLMRMSAGSSLLGTQTMIITALHRCADIFHAVHRLIHICLPALNAESQIPTICG